MKNVWIAMAAVAGLAGGANADLVAYWHFNNSTPGVGGQLGVLNGFNGVGFPSDQGSGLLTSNVPRNTDPNVNNGTLGTFAGTALNAIPPDGSGGALAIQGGQNQENNGRHIQFEFSTAGLQDLILTYATRGTSTGFNSNQVSYSTDGLTFTNFGAPYDGRPSTFFLQTFDFSGVPALDNQANVAVRITLNGSTSAVGNNRFDNVQFNATVIPAPGALALLGLGGLVATRRRR